MQIRFFSHFILLTSNNRVGKEDPEFIVVFDARPGFIFVFIKPSIKFMLLSCFLFAICCGVRAKSEMESQCPAGYWRDVCLTPFFLLRQTAHNQGIIANYCEVARPFETLFGFVAKCSSAQHCTRRRRFVFHSTYVFQTYLNRQNVCNLYVCVVAVYSWAGCRRVGWMALAVTMCVHRDR